MPAVRALPWGQILRAAQRVLERFSEDVPKRDRERLRALVGKSKGDPRRLTADERRELVRILRQLDVGRLGRDLAAELAAARSGRLLKR